MLPLDLPAFQNHPAMQMRTHKENGILYGSIFDCLRWFGLDDDRHNDWHNWAKAEFQALGRLLDSREEKCFNSTPPWASGFSSQEGQYQAQRKLLKSEGLRCAWKSALAQWCQSLWLS